MIYCSDCGNELKEGAKFCTKCGQLVNNEKQAEGVSQQEVSQSGQVSINLQSLNIDKEKLNRLSKGYLTYFKETLLHPFSAAVELDTLNGIISFFLLALLEVLTVWFASSDLYGFTFDFKTGIVLILFLSLFHFSSVGIAHFAQKLFSDSKLSFKETATDYGRLFSGVVLMHALTMIAVLFSSEPTETASMFVFLATLFSLVGFVSYIAKMNIVKKMDSFYITILSVIALFIVWFILFRIGSAVAINIMQQIFLKNFF